jgi:WD40 repeat protein
MGITSSYNNTNSSYGNEGELYIQLINPKAKINPQSLKGFEEIQDSAAAAVMYKKLAISARARLIRKLHYVDLWEAFLNSQYLSFALTPAELEGLLTEASSKAFDKSEIAEVNSAIKDYLELLTDTMRIQQAPDAANGEKNKIDFMAVVSSFLLLNPIPIEGKIEQLYNFITLNPSSLGFTFEEFLIAIASFEKGISLAFFRKPCNEFFLKDVASQWFTLADPLHRNTNSFNLLSNNLKSTSAHDSQPLISSQLFFDFCTNRQHVVRRLIEALAGVDLYDHKNIVLTEVIDTLEEIKTPTSGGDEWMANPAWKKTAERMISKTVREKYVNSKPVSNLEISWIHGYRGFDCRNNLRYVNGASNDEIFYHTAAVGIVLDFNGSDCSNWKQHYFSEHSDDIVCSAVFAIPSKSGPGSTLIATGEIGKQPAICLYSWTCGEFRSLGCLKGSHTKGIAQLAFSPDGLLLFSVGLEYSIAIYCTDQRNSKNFGKLVASAQGPKDRVLHAIGFGGAGNASNNYQFYTCGEKHVTFWKYDKGILKQETCQLDKFKNKIFMSLCCYRDDLVLVSTSDGSLFCLEGKSLKQPSIDTGSFVGHDKAAINAIWSSIDRLFMITGDKDGKIILWDISTGKLRIVFEFFLEGSSVSAPLEGIVPKGGDSLNEAVKPPSIRSVCLSPDGKKLLIGTQACEILEYQLSSEKSFLSLAFDSARPKFHIKPIVSGHFHGELWGLAVRPITEHVCRGRCVHETQYCTVGDDGYLRIWSLQKQSLIGCLNLGGMARACAFSPDGLYLAVGLGGRLGNKKGKNPEDGIVKILRIDSCQKSDFKLVQVSEIKEAKQWISVIKYSPDGATLAVGSRDNNIYLYSVPNQYHRKAKFSKHTSGINQLDFSTCSKFIQSCCRYEVITLSMFILN